MAGGLDWTILKATFQPKPFYGSVILWANKEPLQQRGHQPTGLLWAEHCQHVKGGDPSPTCWQVILPLCSALVRHILVLFPVLGSPVRERHEHAKVSPSEGTWRWLRACGIWHTGRTWESWDCLARRRENSGGFTDVYKYLTGKVKKTEPCSSQQCPVTGQEAMDTIWNTGLPFKHKIPHFFTECGQTLKQVPQRGCGVSSTLGDIQLN